MSSDWLPLQEHYERCLAESGATPRGVDWPNGPDLAERFETQLHVLRGVPKSAATIRLLDLGCGPALLLDYLASQGRADEFDYVGIDISAKMIARARERWPHKSFESRDIVADPLPPLSVDVAILNGVLTERQGISVERMTEMAQALIVATFRTARYGIAFNVMSPHVDWKRSDLFYWGFDDVAAFLKKDVTRHVAIHADYGLYEYTAFAWRDARREGHEQPGDWWER